VVTYLLSALALIGYIFLLVRLIQLKKLCMAYLENANVLSLEMVSMVSAEEHSALELELCSQEVRHGKAMSELKAALKMKCSLIEELQYLNDSLTEQNELLMRRYRAKGFDNEVG